MPTQQLNWDSEIPPLLNGVDDSASQVITAWKWCIVCSYSSPNDIRNTTVQSIQWFKNKEGLEHEFLVVAVQRDDGNRATLRLERRPSQDRADDITDEFAMSDAAALENLPPDARTQLRRDVEQEKNALVRRAVWARMQKITKPSVQANDTVIHTRSPDGQLSDYPEPAWLVATYSSFENPLFLRDLVFAASEVSEQSDAYLVLLQQCYWFCRTIIGVVVKNHACAIEPGLAFHKSGTYSFKTLPLPAIQVNQDDTPEVDRISDKFQTSIQNSDEELHKKYMEGAGGKAIEKERADKEEQGRKDAEEKAHQFSKKCDDLNEENIRLKEDLAKLRQGVASHN